jgi:hypothetical protein
MPKTQVDFEFDGDSTNGLRYLFTEKHHGGPHSAGQAQWLPALSFETEFWVFDQADIHNFRDKDGRLYGILKDPTSFCETIGTRDEQIARFYQPPAGSPWHGHPVYPLSNVKRRSGEVGKPRPEVFARMVEVGLITEEQATRLKKRKHI